MGTMVGVVTVPGYDGALEQALADSIVGSMHFELEGCAGRVFRPWAADRSAATEGTLVVGSTSLSTPAPLLSSNRGWYRVVARNVGQRAVMSVALTDGSCRASEQVLNPSDGGVVEFEAFDFPQATGGLHVELR
jgi:hypothetical protein